MFNHHEVALSTVALSANEAAGAVCPSYFGSRRMHQVPRDWPSAISRFLDRSAPSRQTTATAAPSARRAGPTPPHQAAA